MTRERFAVFVSERRLDSCRFSTQMVSDELLEAFPGENRTPEEASPGTDA